MAYGRKSIPPPSTPFEEFMANASKRMIAAKLQFVEALRELPPAAWIAIGVVILVLAASSLNLRGKKKSAADTAAVAPAADAVADVAPAPASTKEAVVEKVEVATDKAEAAAAAKVDEAAAAAKTEATEKVEAVSEKLGVDACVKIKFTACSSNRRVDLNAIDATPARWRGDVGSSPLDRATAATSSPSAPDTLVDFHTG